MSSQFFIKSLILLAGLAIILGGLIRAGLQYAHRPETQSSVSPLITLTPRPRKSTPLPTTSVTNPIESPTSSPSPESPTTAPTQEPDQLTVTLTANETSTDRWQLVDDFDHTLIDFATENRPDQPGVNHHFIFDPQKAGTVQLRFILAPLDDPSSFSDQVVLTVPIDGNLRFGTILEN